MMKWTLSSFERGEPFSSDWRPGLERQQFAGDPVLLSSSRQRLRRGAKHPGTLKQNLRCRKALIVEMQYTALIGRFRLVVCGIGFQIKSSSGSR